MSASEGPPHVFGFDRDNGPLLRRALLRSTAPHLEKLLGLDTLQQAYRRIHIQDMNPAAFIDAALAELNVEIEYSASELARVPETGPFVIVANHPFGGLEGLLLAKLLLERRKDVRILANYMLERIPEMRDLFLFVDPWSRSSSRTKNASVLKQTLRHLRSGGLLAVFPAGEVAHRSFSDRGELRDPPWQSSVGQIIQRAQAPVLPVHFCGENSLGFQIAGMVHPALRTALLPRELLNKSGRRIEVRIGQPISTRKLKEQDAKSFTAYLQERTEILKHRRAIPPEQEREPDDRPIADPIPTEVIEQEISQLPADRLLVTHGHRTVYMAPAKEIPQLMLELGRLRQLAFREVGEGTDESRDLDRFDPNYHHLFVWDTRDRAIVGAYRVGLVDKLVEQGGRDALYTSTLFDIDPAFFPKVHAALELGRSFVQPQYQRDPTSLMLLWKGIGAFIIQNPQYRYLFGPCSVSHDYAPMSRRLIVRYLDRAHGAPDLASHIQPRIPLTQSRKVDAALPRYDRWMTSITELSNWITHLEADEKRVPVLVRHYVGLGGKILGFNVDPAFGSVVDCFVLVDLADAPPRTLGMFMGSKQARAYLEELKAADERKKDLTLVA